CRRRLPLHHRGSQGTRAVLEEGEERRQRALGGAQHLRIRGNSSRRGEDQAVRIRVLGAAAGGGYPQWNCNHPNSRRARAGDPKARPRTQSSIAVSRDGERWALFNASPDLRQQIAENDILHPKKGLRDSPIKAVVLTNADVDHVTGLLTLRESQPLHVYATRRVLEVLRANAIFNVLNPEFVRRLPL